MQGAALQSLGQEDPLEKESVLCTLDGQGGQGRTAWEGAILSCDLRGKAGAFQAEGAARTKT